MSKTRLLLFCIVLAIVTAVGWWIMHRPASHGDVTTVAHQTVIRAVYATGTVEPVYWAKLSSYKTARLMEIIHYEGDIIHKGDVIARMENRAETQRLNEAKAQLDFASHELKRHEILATQNAISRKQLDDARRMHREASASVQALQHEVDDLTLITPVDGVVLRRDIELGEVAKAGDTIFWVGQTSPLRITADVDEEDIASVKLGQKTIIKADAFEGKAFEGTVDEITPKGDPVNKVFRVRIGLPSDTPLLTGMTTEVNIIAETYKNALVIPLSSESSGFVWKMEGGSPTKTAIKTGVRSESSIQVMEGLKEGDHILTHTPMQE
jgi:RND family efflux transporter MFP subunit